MKNRISGALRHVLLAMAYCLAAGGLAPGGDAPAPPETSLDPARNSGAGQRAAPSAMVKVVIPPHGGQASVRPMSPPETTYTLSSTTPSAPSTAAASPAPWTGEAVGAMPGQQAGGAASPGEAPASGESELRTLATIDGTAITDQDVTRELWARKGRETLDWMVGKAILERELARLDLSVSEAETEACLTRHLDRFATIFPNLSGREALARAASGMGLDEYRQRSVWVELALRKIMQKTLKPTDDQLRVYFAERQAAFVEPERAKIRQIFIAPPPGPDGDIVNGAEEWAAAERLVLEAHTRLRMGEDFLSVASSYASGATNPRWVERGELLRELEEAAFSLRPGAVSAPIRTGMGYHIILVEERRDRKLPRFEDVKDKVLAEYENRYFMAAAGDFMTRLKEKALEDGTLVMMGEATPAKTER